MALLLSDQRMPGMRRRGVPGAGPGILSRGAAGAADRLRGHGSGDPRDQSARIHYFLNKPWDPPEEKLYPALDDLLDDWKAGLRRRSKGLRVIGNRWSLEGSPVSVTSCRAITSRIDGWMRRGNPKRRSSCLRSGRLNPDQLPAVLFADGTMLKRCRPGPAGGACGPESAGGAGVLRHGGGGRGAVRGWRRRCTGRARA